MPMPLRSSRISSSGERTREPSCDGRKSVSLSVSSFLWSRQTSKPGAIKWRDAHALAQLAHLELRRVDQGAELEKHKEGVHPEG